MLKSKSDRLLTAAFVVSSMLLPSLAVGWKGTNFAVSPETAHGSNRDRPDSCEQMLKPNGNANGLNKRCDPVGTGAGAAKGDFNGDGFADLAIGVPDEDLNGSYDAGVVNVIYGSLSGLTSAGDQLLDESIWTSSNENSGNFGWALAAGNFNGDDYVDLAISARHQLTNGEYFGGRVYVAYGSANGLSTNDLQEIFASEAFSDFGAALVGGDFNGDGKADLAVGIPQIKSIIGPNHTQGAVEVFYGSIIGLNLSNRRQLRQGTPGINSDGTLLVGGFAEGDDFGPRRHAPRHIPSPNHRRAVRGCRPDES